MKWEDKVEMARLFNNGKYQEAVELFGRQDDWDEQACDMFVTGMDLTKCELCLPLDERIQQVQPSWLPDFRAQLRWSVLRVELEDLKAKKEDAAL